jgi:hypothetical protein
MKSTLTACALLFALLLLGACNNGPIERLEFKSPEGDRTIVVTGERSSPANPIMVEVTLTVPAGKKPFKFEHHAGSLTNENCKAEWENNNHAVLTFTMSDDEKWVLDCFLLDDRIEAIKRFELDGKSIFKLK